MQRPENSALPTSPGVYLYKDGKGKIIYVGKAKNIRKRVLSYFRAEKKLTPKTITMLKYAVSLDFLSTITEKEALLLEASLIKKHRPRYNIVLRDDKQYILFRIRKNTDWPRLEIARQSREREKNVRYFGPFTSSFAARQTWKLLHRAFPLRRCTDRALHNRIRPCLYYHIGQCLAPCTEDVNKDLYASLVRKVELILSGRSQELLHNLRSLMQEASDRLDFEEAANLRDQIQAVENTVEKQVAVLPNKSDLDVIGLVPVDGGLALGLIFVREGKLIDGQSFFWPKLGPEEEAELIYSFISQFYGPYSAIPPHIIIAQNKEEYAAHAEDYQVLELALSTFRSDDGTKKSVQIIKPRNTEEQRLVKLAQSNALEAAKKRDTPLSRRLANIFGLAEDIVRIECVDVSHTGGQSTRAGMVVFEYGKPQKSEYRTYAFKSDEFISGDDTAALAAWTVRRLKAGPPYADLLLIDGGKGQINAVLRAMQEAGQAKAFAVAGIAKARDEHGRADRRAGNVADRIFVPNRMNPLNMREGSPELLFLQMIRDTAHRFAITRHRKARTRAALSDDLLKLPGVGPRMARLLWDHFGSVKAMRAASPADFAKLPGIGKAKALALAEGLNSLEGKK